MGTVKKLLALHPRRILVIAVPALGDVLLATPLITSLKEAFPDAVIDLVVRHGSGAMASGNPAIRKIIRVGDLPPVRDYVHMIRSVVRRYDLAVSTSASDRSFVCSFFAAPRRISLVPAFRLKDCWKHFGAHARAVQDESTHIILQNLKLAELLKIPKRYELVLPTAGVAERSVDAAVPFPVDRTRYVVIHMLSRLQHKALPAATWEAVTRHLLDADNQVVFTGGGGEEELGYIRSVADRFDAGVHNVAGQLSFAQVVTLLEHARAYLGVDTSVSHIAAATGIPTLAIYGPTNARKWAPWPRGYAGDVPPFEPEPGTQQNGNVTIVHAPCVCIPFNKRCTRTGTVESACLRGLSVEAILSALDQALAVKSPDARPGAR